MRSAYRLAVGAWGVAPSEFGKMSVLEWWWLKSAREPEKMYGSLPESKVDDLIAKQRARKAKEKEAAANVKHTESECQD